MISGIGDKYEILKERYECSRVAFWNGGEIGWLKRRGFFH
jgi:hypothetical protein